MLFRSIECADYHKFNKMLKKHDPASPGSDIHPERFEPVAVNEGDFVFSDEDLEQESNRFRRLILVSAARRTGFDHIDRRGFVVALGLGVVDLLGITAYAWGSHVALLSLVIAASGTFPLVSVAGGIVVLGERPARAQFLGVGLVVAGLVALGLAS